MNARERLPFFVYGTLTPRERNWHMLQDVFERYCTAIASGWQLWHLREGNYPAIVPGGQDVEGLLVWVLEEHWDATLLALDYLEDFDATNPADSLYSRQQTEVTRSTGERVRAWVYIWNPAKQALLEQKGELFEDSRWRSR